jgi:hypothetical protein
MSPGEDGPLNNSSRLQLADLCESRNVLDGVVDERILLFQIFSCLMDMYLTIRCTTKLRKVGSMKITGR